MSDSNPENQNWMISSLSVWFFWGTKYGYLNWIPFSAPSGVLYDTIPHQWSGNSSFVNFYLDRATMHNVLFVQYLLLATEQVGSYFKSCILLYHLTYIYPYSFGCEQNILWIFSWASNSKFVILPLLCPCIRYRGINYPPVSLEFAIEYPPVT